MRLVGIAALAALTAMGMSGCDIPRDPEGTLRSVRGGVLRVGVTETAPWVIHGEDGPEGIEPDLVRQFAERLDAEVHWCWSDTNSNLEALKRYRLDLVIGNLTKENPWKKEVAFSDVYYTETLTVGFGESPAPERLGGLTVCVRDGDMLGALLKEEGAKPREVVDLWECPPPIAAAAWALEAHGLHPVGPQLHQFEHVMAAPPGENGFLLELSRFLAGRESDVHSDLQQMVDLPQVSATQAEGAQR